MRNREKGVVKWYNVKKGYGFIKRDTGGDVFVHQSEIKEYGLENLYRGQVVVFNIERTKKGLQATNVKAPWYTWGVM